MIIDAFTFYNEFDMLDFRLRLLFDHVDAFVIVEADRTFQGRDKPFFLDGAMDRFAWAGSKLVRHKVALNVEGLTFDQPEAYDPNSGFFNLEYQQRNGILAACQPFGDDDLVLLSDVDEIPSLEAIAYAAAVDRTTLPIACDQAFFYYNLNFMRSERWRGTVMAPMRVMREQTPQGLRHVRNLLKAAQPGGWHLSYFGAADFIANKIGAFAHQEYNNDDVKDADRIQACIAQGADLFGRDITMSPPPKHVLPEYFTSKLTNKDLFFGSERRMRAWLERDDAPAAEPPAEGSRISGSDKHFWHRYVDAYEERFARLGAVRHVLEFGVKHGESIRWLRERFPDAAIVGVDILPVQPEWPRDEGITYRHVDQGRRADVAALFRGLDTHFDVVIEDGSHIPQHQATCLIEAVRWIRDGGLYILEDISTSHPDHHEFGEGLTLGARRTPNALNVLLAMQHAKERGVKLRSDQLNQLAAPGFFDTHELEALFDRLGTLNLFKRASLPLRCWRCQSSDFDYVHWRCRCGIEVMGTADSMSYMMIVSDAEHGSGSAIQRSTTVRPAAGRPGPAAGANVFRLDRASYTASVRTANGP